MKQKGQRRRRRRRRISFNRLSLEHVFSHRNLLQHPKAIRRQEFQGTEYQTLHTGGSLHFSAVSLGSHRCGQVHEAVHDAVPHVLVSCSCTDAAPQIAECHMAGVSRTRTEHVAAHICRLEAAFLCALGGLRTCMGLRGCTVPQIPASVRYEGMAAELLGTHPLQ